MGATTSGSVKSESGTTAYERVDSGAYPARCISVIELGSRDNEFQGEVKNVTG